MKLSSHHLSFFNQFIFVFLLAILNSTDGNAQSSPQASDEHISIFNGEKIVMFTDYLRWYLYEALAIYEDDTGEMGFEEISSNPHLFQDNNTYNEAFDPDKVYWLKSDIQARKSYQDSIIIYFQNLSVLLGWEYMDAYLVHEDGKVEHQRTGFSVPKHERPNNIPFTPFSYGLVPNERATIYFRLEKFILLKESHLTKRNGIDNVPGVSYRRGLYTMNLDNVTDIGGVVKIIDPSDMLAPYQFDGEYYESSPNRPFRGNRIHQFDLFQDTSHQLDASYIHKHKETMQWGYTDSITADLGEVYWIKTKLVGSELFNGEHIFHVSPLLGADGYAFENIDVFIPDNEGNFLHQRTGHSVPLKERPYDFWATFIKVDIALNDTVDVYIRLEGMDPYFGVDGSFWLFHIDPSSVFPSQVRLATKRSLFLGAVGLQLVLFLGLFFILRERIHLYFSILIIGQLLTFVFTAESYSNFVFFSSWREYEVPLYYLGIFITSFGMLHFTSIYFNYAPSSIYRKWIIPIFLIPLALMCLYGFFPPRNYLYTKDVMLFSALMMPIYLLMAFQAKEQPKYLKSIFILAFVPVSLVFLRIAGFNWAIFPQHDHLEHHEKIAMVLDWISLAIVFTLWLLGFSIGIRNRLLKKQKVLAEQQNLENNKIIYQKELEAEQLVKLDELKTKLFTNITHEFRTPLTVIMGINDELVNQPYIQKLSNVQRTKAEQNHKLISRNSKNLLNLISQLLDLSKADSGALELQQVQDNIIPYLNYLTESFYSRAGRKNIRLVFYPEIESLTMDFDEAKIQHIIYNLISNALKFTESGGKVILHAKQETIDEKEFLRIVVNDNGIGISEQRMPNIFDRFYQVDNSNTRTEGGSGIGLALVKELVDLMQGQIEVTSTEGKGTSFTVDIPRTNQAPLIGLNVIEKPIISKLSSEESDDYVEEEIVPFVSSELPLLLIVEDNADVKNYICQILEKDYQIVKAENGEIGIEKAFKYIPDIIISDVMMPKVDGNTLTTILKKDTRTNHIPIILLTAKTSNSDKIVGFKSGADAFLTKPFDKQELIIRLDQLLQLRKTLQERYANENLSEAAIDGQLKNRPILSKENLFLNQLQQIVEENIENENLNVEFLATTFKLSTSQLYRKLKALTDVTPNEFIRNLRLKKGLLLLKTTELNVSEVAYAVGFNDPSYFTRAFHKLYGNSPMFYRK